MTIVSVYFCTICKIIYAARQSQRTQPLDDHARKKLVLLTFINTVITQNTVINSGEVHFSYNAYIYKLAYWDIHIMKLILIT